MTQEIWKDIAGYEGLYQVSNLGRVKSQARTVWVDDCKSRQVSEKIMQGNIHVSGYKNYKLSKNNKGKNHKGHRLVATAFIPNPENKPQVNHINGVKTDNRVENLEWATAKENVQHSYSQGLNKSLQVTLSIETRIEIKNKISQGFSINRLSQEYNITSDSIRYINSRTIDQIKKGYRATLSKDQVQSIYRMVHTTNLYQKDIAKQYGTNQDTVSRIKRRKIYKRFTEDLVNLSKKETICA